jgi:hypothetical protein
VGDFYLQVHHLSLDFVLVFFGDRQARFHRLAGQLLEVPEPSVRQFAGPIEFENLLFLAGYAIAQC